LVSTSAEGVPSAGFIIVQEVTRQKFPLPLVFPVASDDVTALEVTACVEPAKCATPAPGDDDVTHDAQPTVPEVVMVPPVRGLENAMLVTVPPVLGFVQDVLPDPSVVRT
jgi:hypothetical protein